MTEKIINYAEGNINIETQIINSAQNSDNNINYNVLIRLLKEKEWPDADRETFYIMREALELPPIRKLTKKEEFEKLVESDKFHISVKHLEKFNCEILLLIDGLWKFLSEQRFGFSVQNEIYTQVSEDWVEFGKKVKWHKEGKWIDGYIYDTKENAQNAPRGHYPLDVIGGKDWDESKKWFMSVRERLKDCKECHKDFPGVNSKQTIKAKKLTEK